jgi:hypothetical protein
LSDLTDGRGGQGSVSDEFAGEFIGSQQGFGAGDDDQPWTDGVEGCAGREWSGRVEQVGEGVSATVP